MIFVPLISAAGRFVENKLSLYQIKEGEYKYPY
jgi:hypothetical protein